MEAQKIVYYLKFLSIRSLFTGDKTKKEILLVVLTLIMVRIAIYTAMTVSNFNPMNYLSQI
jgi:hypothetical protein